jgi:hypothetical protein
MTSKTLSLILCWIFAISFPAFIFLAILRFAG